jgi:hypothetical protein
MLSSILIGALAAPQVEQGQAPLSLIIGTTITIIYGRIILQVHCSATAHAAFMMQR